MFYRKHGGLHAQFVIIFAAGEKDAGHLVIKIVIQHRHFDPLEIQKISITVSITGPIAGAVDVTGNAVRAEIHHETRRIDEALHLEPRWAEIRLKGAEDKHVII